MERAVGIDFGTSTSLIGEGLAGQRVRILPIGRATTEMPSTIGMSGDRLVVGEDAEDLPLDSVARSVKRTITEWKTTIALGDDEDTVVDADHAITEVLRTVADRAASIGLMLTEDAIRLSCPASWNSQQRERLLRLASDAGLPVADHTLIDEPVAAGIAWTVHRTDDLGDEADGKVLVFDMGGGTLDVAHLQVHARPGSDPDITVLSSVGWHQAGDALDGTIAKDLIQRYETLGELSGDVDTPAISSAARSAASEVKVQLSQRTSVTTRFEIGDRRLPAIDYTRGELEAAFEPQWQSAEKRVWECLRASMLADKSSRGTAWARQLPLDELAQHVDHVVLAGGMSRMPMIRERLAALLPHSEVHGEFGAGPVEAVVTGLSETKTYGRISFHRPAYDFVLTFPDGRTERSLYEAYTPLYSFAEAVTRDDVYHDRAIRPEELPRSGQGEVVVRTAQGKPVNMLVDQTPQSGIPVSFGYGPVRLKIKPNGDLAVIDGKRNPWKARVEKWPIIRSDDDSEIVMTQRRHGSDGAWDMPYPFNNRTR